MTPKTPAAAPAPAPRALPTHGGEYVETAEGFEPSAVEVARQEQAKRDAKAKE